MGMRGSYQQVACYQLQGDMGLYRVRHVVIMGLGAAVCGAQGMWCAQHSPIRCPWCIIESLDAMSIVAMVQLWCMYYVVQLCCPGRWMEEPMCLSILSHVSLPRIQPLMVTVSPC